jgi:hypothetical protein
MLSETPIDIGFREIVTLEEKRFAARLAERIAEAVSVIEPRRMATLAIFTESVAGNFQLINGKGDDWDVNARQLGQA